MGSWGGTRRVVAWVGASTVLLAGCTGSPGGQPGAEERSPSESATVAGAPSGSTGRGQEVGGLGFAVPAGWVELDVDDIDPADSAARQVAEQLGVAPEQLGQRMAATDICLFSEAGPQDGFLPTIDAYRVPGPVPADEQIQQDYARVGAEVGDLSREDTPVGEVVVVGYRLPVSATTIEGASVVVADGDRSLIITVSEVDRDRADAVADTVVASLSDD